MKRLRESQMHLDCVKTTATPVTSWRWAHERAVHTEREISRLAMEGTEWTSFSSPAVPHSAPERSALASLRLAGEGAMRVRQFSVKDDSHVVDLQGNPPPKPASTTPTTMIHFAGEDDVTPERTNQLDSVKNNSIELTPAVKKNSVNSDKDLDPENQGTSFRNITSEPATSVAKPAGKVSGNKQRVANRSNSVPPRKQGGSLQNLPSAKTLIPNVVEGKPGESAPHVKYVHKEDKVPCSITETMRHFPEEDIINQDINGPPKHPPSNLTVVTVEGCPSFVILDWEKVKNDTATEYEVISKEGGSTGKEESVLTTNQTHTAVENLKPNTSYEFRVKPVNILGEGPESEPVTFSTESGKDAIWTQIPFKADSYSECNGKMFVKRTWYRKFVGIQLCNSLRYKIYLSDTLTGTFYNIGDQSGQGEDHCQFVDSFLDGRTGKQYPPDQLPPRQVLQVVRDVVRRPGGREEGLCLLQTARGRPSWFCWEPRVEGMEALPCRGPWPPPGGAPMPVHPVWPSAGDGARPGRLGGPEEGLCLLQTEWGRPSWLCRGPRVQGLEAQPCRDPWPPPGGAPVPVYPRSPALPPHQEVPGKTRGDTDGFRVHGRHFRHTGVWPLLSARKQLEPIRLPIKGAASL
ncbi:TARSH protein, partial [Polypterus senegalus]